MAAVSQVRVPRELLSETPADDSLCQSTGQASSEKDFLVFPSVSKPGWVMLTSWPAHSRGYALSVKRALLGFAWPSVKVMT